MIENEKNKESPSILRSTARWLIDDFKESLRWALGGALVGGLLAGGFGLYHLGLPGLVIGLVVGALVGGIAIWLAYHQVGS